MFGFSYLESQNKEYSFSNIKYNDMIISETDVAINHMINKFEKDKIFSKQDDCLIILDGVILNKKQLIEKYSIQNENNDWCAIVKKMYTQNGKKFFDEFRGSFSGVLRDYTKDITIVFSDHIGSKFLYYTYSDSFFLVSSYISNIYSFFKENNIKYSLSVEAAYMMLTYGYMLEENTLCQQIKKLYPGHYICIEHGKITNEQYCKVDIIPDKSISLNDAINIVDENFQKLIIREFEKDKEYNYEHFVNLSGGLDSRMTSLVAHDLGYIKQNNLTFSQTGAWDQIIPQKIAEDYRHDWIFKSLDGGGWLENIEGINEITGGNVLYIGLAHGYSMLRLLNVLNMGIIHTGQLGDVLVGRSYYSSTQEYKIGTATYSKFLIDRLSGYKLSKDYESCEMGIFYNRGLIGVNNGLLSMYNFSESFTPFFDIDFIKKAFTIPLFSKDNNKLYKQWILSKYPEYAKYGWAKLNGRKITAYQVKIKGKEICPMDVPHRFLLWICKKYNISYASTLEKKGNMNPINYYLSTNKNLYQYLVKYFEDNIHLIEDPQLKKDILYLFSRRNNTEVAQAITLLSAVKMFF